MCDAGRIKHHLKYNISRPDSAILFVGYQAEGSLGRRLTDGVPEVKIFGEAFQVRAEILVMDGLSGHADKNGLLEWIGAFRTKPKQVFVVHGDDAVAESGQNRSRYLSYMATTPWRSLLRSVFRRSTDCMRWHRIPGRNMTS